MDFFSNPHYQAIREHYVDRRAKRSGVLYLQHIDEGLIVLDAIQASQSACEAYCLHPIVQSNEALLTAFQADSVLRRYTIDLYAMALVMEYRSVANAYLSTRQIQSLSQIRLSPLLDVQHMLIADKVQNRKDFEYYHLGKHPRSSELERYFKNWLEVLGISESRYCELAKLIEQR
jgi:hypothetical protein